MALFRKLFYRKPPDGLLEICERVYVFDCCFTTDAFEDYKGYVGGIIAQLREHYPDASILAFNFREGQTQSQIANALTEYDMTIMEYPRQYEGCPLLPMEVIHHFLRSSESWLSLGLQNLLLMHCERGGWPVLAFMLAALLIYRKHYSGELKTLDMVYKQAPRELLHLLTPLNPVPSQLRYLQYVSRRNVATEWPPLDRALTMDCVIIRFRILMEMVVADQYFVSTGKILYKILTVHPRFCFQLQRRVKLFDTTSSYRIYWDCCSPETHLLKNLGKDLPKPSVAWKDLLLKFFINILMSCFAIQWSWTGCSFV
ncbi:UNVERIFIED_CONTAM: Formin-like protein 13 [Sesamum angustifolium]|uniref:Formin-like protein 13 n=1 Tax=Sesamum angustifolium TaxID=2727405 RepID=A0AAW2PUB4_9LAMI